MYRFLTLGAIALFLIVSPVNAQKAATTQAVVDVPAVAVTSAGDDVAGLVKQDEEVTAADLGVSEPTILPDSGFYFLKNWGRGVRSFFTFNQVKKAELNLRYTDERLYEIKKLAEKTKDSKKVEEAMKKYEVEKEKLKSRIEKIKDNPKNAKKMDRLLDKITDKEIKHQKLLDRLEKDMPEEVREKIENQRERALKVFSDTLSETDTPEKLQERLEKIIEAQKGSKFKRFKNLEILQRIEEKVPEQAKKAIRKVQENSMKRLRDDLSQMSPDDREKFSDYIEKISGNAVRQTVLLDKLDQEDIPEDLKKAILLSRDRAFKKVEDKLSEIKDEKRKEGYLKYLEEGNIENVKILKRLENNLDPEAVKRIIAVKKRTQADIRKRLDDPQKRAALFAGMENLDDVEMFDVLDDIEGSLPESKRDFTREARRKAKIQILKKLDEATTDKEKERILRKLSDDNPSGLEAFEKIIEKATPEEKEKLKKIREYQLERINKRIEETDDPIILERLKDQIEKRAEIRKVFEELSPETLKRVKDRPEEVREKMNDKMEKANESISELKDLIQQADPKNPKLTTAKEFLKKAVRRVQLAKKLYSENEVRKSYGHLVSAFRLAENGIKILDEDSEKGGKLNGDSKEDSVSDKTEKQRELKKDRLEKKRENAENERERLKDRLEKRRDALKDKEEKMRDGVECTQEYTPVCGIDGETYSNPCTAIKQNGVRVAYKGECKSEDTEKELDKATPKL